MVAIVSGNGAGILNTSAGTLGQGGVFGNATNGNSKDSVYINIANGNLLMQDQDDCIDARGVDTEIVRTYNSQGVVNSGDGVGWRQTTRRQLTGLTGTVNTAGSTITRTVGDGSVTVFTYDVARAAYVTTEGGGAYQTITYNVAYNQWIWQSDHNDQYGEQELYVGTTGLIHSATDFRYGAVFYFTYDASNRLSKLTNARGDTTYFDFVNGNVSKVRTVMAGVTGDFSRVSYQYDALNRLTGVVTDLTPENKADAKTYTVNYTYLSNTSQVETVTQSDGTRLTFTYVLHDGKNKVASVTDALGRSTSFDYTQPGKTIVTDSLGFKTAYAYDTNGQLLSVTAPAVAGVSQITQFEYDAAGNISRTIDARGLATTYGYDGNGNRILERDSTGATITRIFSSTNKVLSETRYVDLDPDGAGSQLPTQKLTTRYVYDNYSVLRFIISPEGRVQEYRYNAQHQLLVDLAYIGIKFADNSPESAYAYNAMVTWSQSTAVKAAAATRVDYAYDGRGLVMQSTSYAATAGASNAAPAIGPDTAIVQYVYDHAGQLLQSIDGNGNTTTYTYDGLGRQLSATDAEQNVVLHTYDDAGNRIVTRRTDGVTSTSTYDKAGQLVATVLAEANGTVVGTTSYLYDNEGRLRTVIDPNGGRSHILYDEAGRKTATVTAAGSLTEYRYDANNQLALTIAYATTVSQASLAALIGADGKPVTATLETAGLRPAATAADQRAWRLYDNANRLLKTVDALGYVTDYSYDGASRLLDTIRRATVIDLTAFAANPAVANASPAPHANDRIARNSYDKDGKLRFTMDGEGYLSELQYDLAGRHTGTVRYAAAVDPAARSGAGWMTVAAGSAGITTSSSYDGRGQVVSQTDGAGNTTTFTYDGQGNVLTSTTAGVATRYVYDKLNRLIETHADANGSNVTSKVAYDAQGNKVAVTDAMGNTTRLVYDASNRQVFSIDPLGIVTETRYNANGNAVAAIRYSKAINVDSAEQVLGASDVRAALSADIESIVHQRYDRDGRLTWTVDATGVATQLVYNAKGNVVRRIAYKNALGTVDLASLAANPDAVPMPASEFTATSYVYDENDRLVFTIDALGAVAESRYDAQGNVVEAVRYATPIDTSNTQTPAVLAVRALLRVDAAKDVHEFRRYDKEGRLTWSVDATGAATQFIYDANGNVVKRLAYAEPLTAAALASLAADASALPALAGPSTMTQFAYDGDNRLLFTVDPLGIVSENRYDVRGNVVETVRYAVPITLANNVQLTAASIKPLLQADAKDVHQFQRYDALGRLVWNVDGTGAATQLFYDNSGNLIKRLAFAERLAPAAMASLAGNASALPAPAGASAMTQYAYDADNRLVFTVDALGIVTENRYDANGKAIETVRYAAPVVLGDSTQQLTAPAIKAQLLADAAKDAHQFQRYDKDGRLAWSVDATGAVTQLIYDTQGNVLKRLVYAERLAASALASLGADASALPAVTGASNVIQYVYDADNRLVFTIDALGAVAENRYDALGNVIETVRYATPIDTSNPQVQAVLAVRAQLRPDASKDIHQFQRFDKEGRLTWSVDAAGAVTQVFYDTKGNVISRVAYTTALSAAAMNQLAADPSSMPAPVAGSAASNYVYDDDNRLAFTIDPFGAVSESRYDVNGNVIETVRYATPIQSRNGLTVSSVRSLLSVDSAKDIHQRNRYDSNGRLTWSIDALGGVTEHRYDANGNVSRTIVYASGLAGTLADGAVPQVVVTAPGSSAYVLSNAQDRVTDYVYDAKGRLISQTDAVGTSVATSQSWAYDSAGNAIRHTDGRGNTSWSAYDAANRLVRHIDAAGHVTTRSYFADGRVKSETRYTNAVALPQGANDAWAYAAANPVANSDPLAGDQTTSWTYDSAGRVQTSTDAANVVTFYAYDGLGNLTDTTVAYGTAAASTVHRNYDRTSRVSTETRAYGTIDAFTTQYGYDTWGNQTTITAGGLTTTQYFDVLGRKTGVKDASQALTTTTYNVFGDIVKVTDARNNSGYFFTDALGRVTMQVDPEGAVSETRYDLQGNVASVIRYANKVLGPVSENARPQVLSMAGSGVYVVQSQSDQYQENSFDALGRTKETRTWYEGSSYYTESFEYDGNGNKKVMTSRNGGVTTYEYDKNNRLVIETLPVTSKDAANASMAVQNRLEYDARGNVVKKIEAYGLPEQRVTTCVFDKLNRQVKEIGEPITTFDPVTRQDVLVTPTKEQKYDLRGNLVEEVDARGGRTLHFYDNANRETGRIDSLGTYTRLTYDIAGQKASQTVYANAVQVVGGGAVSNTSAPVLLAPASALPASGAYLQLDAANDRTTNFTYDGAGRLKTTFIDGVTTGVFNKATNRYVVGSGTVRTQVFYDATGNATKTIDANGNVSRSYYNKAGQLTATLDSMRYLTVYERDAFGNVKTKTSYANALGPNVVVDDSTTQSLLTVVASADDRITAMTYDRMGRTRTESRLNLTYASVDATTGAVSETAGAAITTYEYDGLSNVIRRTDANGAVTDWRYDSLGRKTEELQAAFVDYRGVTVRTITDLEYDGLNQVRREIVRGEDNSVETDDRITRYFYGTGGHLVSQTDAGNARIDYRVDAAGNITRKTLVGRVNADGVRADDVTYYWYDAQGREVRHADGATSTTVETRYNAFGEITGKRTNPAAGSTEWAEFTDYDQTGRAWRSNSGDGITHIYLHDANGNGTLKLDHATTDLRSYTLLSALNLADSNQFYSVYDARNQLSDTYQPPMNGQHNLITVEESLTQKQGTSFAGVGSFISMGVASGLTSADSAAMPSATGAVSVVRALSAALTLTDQYSISTKYYGGATMRGASHTLTVNLPDTSYLGPGAVRVDFSVPESGSLGGYQGSFYPTAGAPSITFNEPVDWEFDQMPLGRDFSITLYKESANGLVVLGTRNVWRPAPGGGSSTVNTTIATSGNALKFTGQRSDTQRLILMTRPSGSTGGWTVTEVPKAVVNGGVEAGSFSLDWTGWPRNSYEFRYVCFNGSNDVVNSQQGTMVLNDSNPSISQVSHSMGGPGRAFFDANGSIVFNELRGDAASLTVSYRPQGGNWTTVQLWPSNVGGTALPGWFTLPTSGFGAGSYEYTIDARNSSNRTVNKSSSTFTIGSPNTISDPSGVSVQTTPAATVSVAATAATTRDAYFSRKTGWHFVFDKRYEPDGYIEVPNDPYNSLSVQIPDTSCLGTGNVRVEFKVEPSYGDGSYSGGYSSVTVPYTQNAAGTYIMETVSGGGGTDSVYYSYRVLKQTPYGEVQVAAYGGWSRAEGTSDNGSTTVSPVQSNLNWLVFNAQPAVQGARMLLEFRRQGDPGPWDLVTIPPQVINGQTVSGSYATDWTTWPAGAYEYRTLVIDAVGNTLQTGTGTMNLGSPLSVSPPTQDLIGGAGRVYMDRAGSLVFTEQSTATETLTIRYRRKGSDELWSTRADLPRTTVPGWFVFTPPADAPADMEYVLEARRGGQLLNKVAGTFTKGNANSVSALQGYTEPPAVTHFKSQPASAAVMRLSYRQSGTGAYTTVNLTKVATGVFDWASGGIFGSDSENRNYDYIYETLDSNGVLVNKAHGLMTLGRDPRVVSHVSDSTPTMASFNVPGGNPVAATATTMVLQYRLLGSNGPFLTVDLPKGANNAFVWDASSIVPPGTSGAVDYSYTLKNGSTVLKRDDGADIRVDGTLYLGPTDGDAQLKWLQSGTVNNVALIHHAQKTNAFGEVVSETNARDFTTVSVYNALGKLVRKEDPNVNVTLSNGYQYGMTPRTYYYYDRAGRMLASRDANGNLTSQILLAGSGAVASELHADGGRKESGYDLFGDLRYGKDEIGLRTDYSYDKNGRLTLIQRPVRTDATRAEVYMTYDEAGNRITQAATPDASSSLASYTSKTYYDSLGRVSKVLTPAGRSSNYTYVWDAAIKSTGGRVVGGWRQTVSDPMGRTVIDEIDAYGRTTAHTDLGGHKFYYNFNFAGWLASQTGSTGQNISYTYYANGYVKSIRDNALQTESSYEYDAAGNRTYEAYQRTVNGQVEYLENSSIDYDSNNRVIRIRDPRADIQYEYDAVGNRRRVHSMYHDGVNGSVQIQDFWYDYDNMNRFILTMGKLSSANGARGTSASDTSVRVVLGGGEGVEVHYNKASQRIMTVAARDGHREDYTYGVEGYLEFTYINANASAQGALASMRVNDRLGRTVGYTEYSNGNISYQRTTVYTADGRQKSQTGTDGTTTYYYYNSRQANGNDNLADISSDGVGELAKVQTVKAGAATVTNVTSYEYWDDAKQRGQSVSGEAPYKTDTVWRPGVSWFEYDINGHLVKSVDAGVDGKMDTADDVSFRFITNGQGLILRREQFKGNTVGMMHRYMYLNGVMVGDVGNDGDSHLDYAQTLATQNQSREQMYKNWRPVSSADFDQNYQPINRSYPAATGSSYTVKAGDSLYSIAGAVWGDVSMWYLIADANGLSAETELQPGQTLTIPNKVTNIHNNSGTFRPYEPGTIIGDTSPTLPDAPMPAPPPRKHGCGVVGQIIMVVVAVIATIYTAGAAAGLFAGQGVAAFGLGAAMSTGVGLASAGLSVATVGAAAIGGALGSIASQAVGVAIGAQDKINWRGVAMSAIGNAASVGVSSYFNAGAAATGATSSSTLLSGNGWQAAAGRAMVANAATQGIANIVGLQKGFNWRGVAAAGASAAVGSYLNKELGLVDSNGNSVRMDTGAHLLRATASGFGAGVVGAAMRSGKVAANQIAIDAFANSLGDGFVSRVQEQSGIEALAKAKGFDLSKPGAADAVGQLYRHMQGTTVLGHKALRESLISAWESTGLSRSAAEEGMDVYDRAGFTAERTGNVRMLRDSEPDGEMLAEALARNEVAEKTADLNAVGGMGKSIAAALSKNPMIVGALSKTGYVLGEVGEVLSSKPWISPMLESLEIVAAPGMTAMKKLLAAATDDAVGKQVEEFHKGLVSGFLLTGDANASAVAANAAVGATFFAGQVLGFTGSAVAGMKLVKDLNSLGSKIGSAAFERLKGVRSGLNDVKALLPENVKIVTEGYSVLGTRGVAVLEHVGHDGAKMHITAVLENGDDVAKLSKVDWGVMARVQNIANGEAEKLAKTFTPSMEQAANIQKLVDAGDIGRAQMFYRMNFGSEVHAQVGLNLNASGIAGTVAGKGVDFPMSSIRHEGIPLPIEIHSNTTFGFNQHVQRNYPSYLAVTYPRIDMNRFYQLFQPSK